MNLGFVLYLHRGGLGGMSTCRGRHYAALLGRQRGFGSTRDDKAALLREALLSLLSQGGG